MVGGADDSSTTVKTYNVRLVAASGREQGVILRIRRDGLWLYTEGGKVMLFGGVWLVYCIVAWCSSCAMQTCPVIARKAAAPKTTK